jgi:xanthine dehydrogenase FAD-binding subunit
MDSVVVACNAGDGVGPDVEPVEKYRLITSTDPMPTWKNYLLPITLPQAFQFIQSHGTSCQIVSGGTDLLLELQQEHRAPVETLIDVTRIPELNVIEIRAERLFIGAAVPLKQVTESPLVRQHALALSESTGQIGGPQVRAVGTLGGNVGHALPAGDGAISLLALDAQVEVASATGTRRVPLAQLYKGVGVSTLEPGKEIIVGFDVTLQHPGQASAFSRVMRPQGVALSIINMAIWLEVLDHHIIKSRLAVGPAGPVPKQAQNVDSFLAGKELSAETLDKAKCILHDCVQFRSSPLRATSGYRDHLAEVLLERVLTTAFARAQQSIIGGRQP